MKCRISRLLYGPSLLRGRYVSCQVNARHPTPLLLEADYQVAAGPFRTHGHGGRNEGETTQG